MPANSHTLERCQPIHLRFGMGFAYGMNQKPLSDDEGNKQLDPGTKEIIDKKLEELNVSKTSSGKDQTCKPDTEGSSSSSKNLDEQDD
ncbi:hypothetical protein [Caballeronia sp. GAWG1-1]|uniref:hypothetical protein n=1 Tax=Caballeronia sp. GAWG1-1 TaxID=2921742 RepID=UPI002028964A|nr:hypothetical protein [Caballeronia sp. GAWG1-1]